jgi:hypothetical protein
MPSRAALRMSESPKPLDIMASMLRRTADIKGPNE